MCTLSYSHLLTCRLLLCLVILWQVRKRPRTFTRPSRLTRRKQGHSLETFTKCLLYGTHMHTHTHTHTTTCPSLSGMQCHSSFLWGNVSLHDLWGLARRRMSAKVGDKIFSNWQMVWYNSNAGLVCAGIIPQSRVGTSEEHVWISWMDQRTQSPLLCLVRWLKNYFIIMKTKNIFPYSIVVAIRIKVWCSTSLCIKLWTLKKNFFFIFCWCCIYTPGI